MSCAASSRICDLSQSSVTDYLAFCLSLPLNRFQYGFLTILLLPTQGFFNAMIYFHSPMKQPRQRTVERTCSCTSDVTDFTPSLRQLRSRRPISGSADPIASIASVVDCVIEEEEEEELQDSADEDPDADQMGRN
jgi:hypothetical protein